SVAHGSCGPMWRMRNLLASIRQNRCKRGAQKRSVSATSTLRSGTNRSIRHGHGSKAWPWRLCRYGDVFPIPSTHAASNAKKELIMLAIHVALGILLAIGILAVLQSLYFCIDCLITDMLDKDEEGTSAYNRAHGINQPAPTELWIWFALRNYLVM